MVWVNCEEKRRDKDTSHVFDLRSQKCWVIICEMIRGEKGVWEQHQGFGFKHVNYEMFIKHPNEFIG